MTFSKVMLLASFYCVYMLQQSCQFYLCAPKSQISSELYNLHNIQLCINSKSTTTNSRSTSGSLFVPTGEFDIQPQWYMILSALCELIPLSELNKPVF